MRGRAWLRAMGGAVLVVASCGSTPYFPPPPMVVELSMKEYSFSPVPRQDEGHIVFDVRNEGKLSHDLALVELPEDAPPIHEQLRSKKRRSVPTIARIPAHAPDTRATFAVELTPGRYAIICFVKDPDGIQHDQKGMSTEFRVR